MYFIASFSPNTFFETSVSVFWRASLSFHHVLLAAFFFSWSRDKKSGRSLLIVCRTNTGGKELSSLLYHLNEYIKRNSCYDMKFHYIIIFSFSNIHGVLEKIFRNYRFEEIMISSMFSSIYLFVIFNYCGYTFRNKINLHNSDIR